MENVYYNWDKSVSTFFSWAEIVCGLEPSSDSFKMLRMVVTNQSDLVRFVDVFNGDINDLSTTIYKLM